MVDGDAVMEAPRAEQAAGGTPRGEAAAKQGPSERALATLKDFARMAWDECRVPLPDSVGTAAARREIYSTWTLLLCLHHAEAEAERCQRAGWTPRPWKTEAQALRHLFLQSRSVRALAGVLRWLRWAHRWGAGSELHELPEDAPAGAGEASYDRTRRALLLDTLPAPLRGGPGLHPDGPLQQPGRFDEADLADEDRLLQRLFTALRRGDLRGALRLCAEGGQPWRTALLQGMFPFAEEDDDDEPSYEIVEELRDEEILAALKEDHTDWTEIGAVNGPSTNNGNPWRRVWKEQCWDSAQRHSQQAQSAMNPKEVGIYGLCAGHREALALACDGSWADHVWAELHCLKEWLVETLLEQGREEWCAPGVFLGEGDFGCPDPSEDAGGRAARAGKLCGGLRAVRAAELDAEVARRVRAILDESLRGRHAPRGTETAHFAVLQATLVHAAWRPEASADALELLRHWLSEGQDGSPCHFAVKQFASHFAIWQKHALEDGRPDAVAQCPAPVHAATGDVDDIVQKHVGDLISSAVAAWQEQCLEGTAIEVIAEFVESLTKQGRLSAFATFLLKLRPLDGEGEAGGVASPERMEVLRRCLWIFWGRFPQDVFALLAVVVRSALHLDDASAAEQEALEGGQTGVRAGAEAADVSLALLCIQSFWVVARDKAEAGKDLSAVLTGLEAALGYPLDESSRTGLQVHGKVTPGQLRRLRGAGFLESADRPEAPEQFARCALELVVLPLLGDVFLSLTVLDSAKALAHLPTLIASPVWRDAFSCGAPGAQTLAELEWMLTLCEKHGLWQQALQDVEAQRRASMPRRAATLDVPLGAPLGPCGEAVSAAESRLLSARDGMLDCARPRLAQDRPLLQPAPGTNTTLPQEQWQRLCSAVAGNALFLLLAVFEGTTDFDGAMNDLVVAVGQSPWMLQRLSPRHARHFLQRLASLPARLEGSRLGAALGA